MTILPRAGLQRKTTIILCGEVSRLLRTRHAPNPTNPYAPKTLSESRHPIST
ncbi:hypothetical protein [Azospirillum doebereinerae]